MVWFRKGKSKDQKDKRADEGIDRKSPANQKPPEGSGEGQRQKTKSDSEKLREQALANARAARAAIGEDTIQKIAAAMKKKQQSPIEQAKARIYNAEAERVAEEILDMLKDKH